MYNVLFAGLVSDIFTLDSGADVEICYYGRSPYSKIVLVCSTLRRSSHLAMIYMYTL